MVLVVEELLKTHTEMQMVLLLAEKVLVTEADMALQIKQAQHLGQQTEVLEEVELKVVGLEQAAQADVL
jgi:hypothetical protein